MKHTLTLLTALLLVPPAALHAADFHVATNGSDTNSGTQDKPFKTIAAGVAGLKAGDTLLVGPGVYRETIKVTSSGAPGQPITIAAEKKGTVTIRGSALVTGWRRSEENSKMFIHEGWDKYFGKWDESLVKGGDQFKAKFGDPKTTQTMAFNQVFVNGTLIREVACPAKREAGTFYIDKEKKQIQLWLANDADPNQCSVEVTDRDVLLQVMNVSHLHVKGLKFEHCANGMMGQAAVLFRGGRNNLIEDCVVQYTAMVGLTMNGDNHVVRRCVMNHNGQQGFACNNSENVLIEDSETSFNNLIPWKQVSPAFKSGGFKVQSSHKVKFLRHTAISNYGPGFWFDVSNDDCEAANCYAAGNRAGILNEISFRIHVHDSVFVNNNPNNGISIAESPSNVIERNIIIDNGCGVYFRDMLRSTPEVSIVNGRSVKGKNAPIWNHDEVVRQNIFLNNARAQINFGVQGINEKRQVPQRLLGSQKLTEQGKKFARDEMTKLGEDYVDKHGVTLSMQPKGLYLEKLNFVINGNVYWSGGKGPLMQWDFLLIYENLEDVRAGEGFEKDGVVLDPQFADWKNLDLRVPSDSPLLKSGCYPQGEVPGVKLGISK